VGLTASTYHRSRGYGITVPSTLLPVFTLPIVFTLPSALANTLQGLASRVSLPLEIGVRPNPMAMAGPGPLAPPDGLYLMRVDYEAK